MLQVKKIIGADVSDNSVLVTLLDGRCGLVDKDRRNVVVEILVDSFYKWMDFPNPVSDEEEEIIREIVENPIGVGFGPLAKEYLTDETVKRKFDTFKKETGYDYWFWL